MTSTRNRLLVSAAIAVLLALAAWWYWSPYVAIHSLVRAAQARDADTFNQYVDYPKLRESLKGQFGANMAMDIAKQNPGDSAFAKAATAIGSMLGMALADKFIDVMVQPRTVMAAMAQAKLPAPSDNPPAGNAPPDAGQAPAQDTNESDRIHWSIERRGVDRVIAHGTRGDEPSDQSPGFVFDRSGFATWKLTEIRLPVSH